MNKTFSNWLIRKGLNPEIVSNLKSNYKNTLNSAFNREVRKGYNLTKKQEDLIETLKNSEDLSQFLSTNPESKTKDEIANEQIDSINWKGLKNFDILSDFVIHKPQSDLEKKFNDILCPGYNDLEKTVDKLVSYAEAQPKKYRAKRVENQLIQMIEEGIEVRLLTEEEFQQKLNEKEL